MKDNTGFNPALPEGGPYGADAGAGGTLRIRLVSWLVIVAAALAAPAWLLATSPFAPKDTVRHYLAATHCTASSMLGLASAPEGSPGYHAHLDADGDGIACEPAPAAHKAPTGGSSSKGVGGSKWVRP